MLAKELPVRGICEYSLAVLTGIAPDRFTFNALLEAHAAVGNLEGASQIYDAMSQRRIVPDICTFIALFQVHIGIPVPCITFQCYRI